MNTPNKLTLFRIIMVLPFITFMSISFAEGTKPDFSNFHLTSTWTFLVGGIIFVIAMITDYFDGYLARKNKQVTTFGKLFDPLADKIMTTSAMVFLSLMQIVPFYVMLIFVLRDILVDGFRNLAASKKIDVSASNLGKAKTMIQSIGLALIFFLYPIWSNEMKTFTPFNGTWELFLLNIPLFISASLSIASGIKYFSQIKKHIDTK